MRKTPGFAGGYLFWLPFGCSWSHSFPLLAIFEFFPRFAYTGFHPLAVLLTGEENSNMAQNRKTALFGHTNKVCQQSAASKPCLCLVVLLNTAPGRFLRDFAPVVKKLI